MKVTLHKPNTQQIKNIKIGWSWTLFFSGIIPFLYPVLLFRRGLTGWGWYSLVAEILFYVTPAFPQLLIFDIIAGIQGLYLCSTVNKKTGLKLLEQGWKFVDPNGAPAKMAKAAWGIPDDAPATPQPAQPVQAMPAIHIHNTNTINNTPPAPQPGPDGTPPRQPSTPRSPRLPPGAYRLISNKVSMVMILLRDGSGMCVTNDSINQTLTWHQEDGEIFLRVAQRNSDTLARIKGSIQNEDMFAVGNNVFMRDSEYGSRRRQEQAVSPGRDASGYYLKE